MERECEDEEIGEDSENGFDEEILDEADGDVRGRLYGNLEMVLEGHEDLGEAAESSTEHDIRVNAQKLVNFQNSYKLAVLFYFYSLSNDLEGLESHPVIQQIARLNESISKFRFHRKR